MANRTMTFSIFRHDPQDPESKPRMQDFEIEETPRMTLFTVLSKLREDHDPGLSFDFVCRSAICGSCGMLVNGKPRLACRTRTGELPDRTTLLPLPFFRLIGDLSVDTGAWFRQMGQRLQSWVHSPQSFDPDAPEERMTNEDAQSVYELDRCIECGCCLSACATAQMKTDFVGAAGLMRLGRFLLDPRDLRSNAEVFDVVGSDDGIFGCVGILACEDYCPKELPMATQMAYIRRKLALSAFLTRGEEKATLPAE